MSTAAGAGSLTINIPAGRTGSADFYVQGLANNGVVSFTASSTGFGSATGAVTLTRSSFVVSGPFGVGTDFFTTTGADNTNLSLLSTRLDSGFNSIEPQPVRGGLTIDVPVASATLATGTITGSPVRFTGGVGSATAQFHPMGAGTTLISLAVPTGFTPAATGGSLTATVRVPGLVIEDGVTVGNNLQAPGNLLLGQTAPAGGLAVTLTSNSANLLLSNTESGAGANSITISMNAGQTSAVYYLQGRGYLHRATRGLVRLLGRAEELRVHDITCADQSDKAVRLLDEMANGQTFSSAARRTLTERAERAPSWCEARPSSFSFS